MFITILHATVPCVVISVVSEKPKGKEGVGSKRNESKIEGQLEEDKNGSEVKSGSSGGNLVQSDQPHEGLGNLGDD